MPHTIAPAHMMVASILTLILQAPPKPQSQQSHQQQQQQLALPRLGVKHASLRKSTRNAASSQRGMVDIAELEVRTL